MGIVYDCALCGVCEYSHEGAPHVFRYPEEQEMRLRTFRDALKLCEMAESLEQAQTILKVWLRMEQDKECWHWKKGQHAQATV